MRGRTIVVGGGLAGLACAFELDRREHDVLVLEAAERAGGAVGTVARNGFLFEIGASTVLASARAFRNLCTDLAIDERLVASSPSARTRWLFHRGRLRKLPTSPRALLASDLLSARGKVALATEPLRTYTPPEDSEGEPTLESFLVDRLGSEAAFRLGGAFVRGIYAAELDELGAASAFPRLYELAAEHGSLVRGALAHRRRREHGPLDRSGARRAKHEPARGTMLGFAGGLRELVVALESVLGDRLRLRARATSIERFGDGWLVRCADGASLPCATLVVATPAARAAEILGYELHAQEHAFVASVKHADVTVVHLGFDSLVLPEGFGLLVPPDEPEASAPLSLGTIFTTNVFEGRAPIGCSATASFYRGADVDGLDEHALVEHARADLALALVRDVPPPIEHVVIRWHGVIPRHGVGHRARVESLRAALHERAPLLELAGAWLDGVSLDAVIASGRAAATRLVEASAREEILL